MAISELSFSLEDVCRDVDWSRHDADDRVVVVQGSQYTDGRVDRYIAVHPTGACEELSAADSLDTIG